jgi:hypothetical protein
MKNEENREVIDGARFPAGRTWQGMELFWKFPDWHAGLLRHIGLYPVVKRDRGKPETFLAEQVLKELRGMITSTIGCSRLYRSDIAGNLGWFKKFSLAAQAIIATNDRSCHMHDRLSRIPDLSGMIEHHCIICSMFAAFRYLVRFYPLDSSWGTPTDWELSLIGKDGDSFLLDLLHRLAEFGDESGIGPIHRDDLMRYPVFVKALIDKATSRQPEATAASQNAPPPTEALIGKVASQQPEAPVVPQNASPINVPEDILSAKQNAKVKWKMVVQIAEILITRPEEEITAKEIWKMIGHDQAYTEQIKQHVSQGVSIIRSLLKERKIGWYIPSGNYVVRSNKDNSNPDIGKLQSLLSQLKESEYRE